MEQKLFLNNSTYFTYKNINNNSNYDFDLLYLHGFYSSMNSTKCLFFENFCKNKKINFIALNYLGHGSSSGKVEDFTITDWLKNIKTIIDKFCHKRLLLLGSSMGSWLSFITALNYKNKIKGIVGISSAIDFLTEAVKPHIKSQDLNKEIVLQIPDKQGNIVNNITKKLLIDGEKYNLLNKNSIEIKCPIRFIHGMQDELINYTIPLKFIKKVKSENVKITIIKNANHFMQKDENINIILENLNELIY